ncbi:MAG: SDR family NAD(P)-dependent oxidoreductase [Halobacteriaceae archaeon]
MTRTAIVTGASGGIGRAVAAELGSDHDVLVHYHRDEAGAREAAAAVREAGNEAVVHGCDLSDPDAAASMVEAASAEFDRVDVLVNNAGVFLERGIEEITRAEIDLEVDVNLKGTVYCTRAVLPEMVAAGGGHVVTVASTSGTNGSPTDPVYAASKGAGISLTKSLAQQYTSAGVYANAVAPGPTATPLMREERRPHLREQSPLGRLVDPAEVAEAVRFFATATAVAGQVVVVDGGWTL